MGSRVFGAIGLSLAMLVTACTSTTGGPGGVATASGAAATAAAATASAVAKATCQTKKITIAVPVTPPNVVHLTPYVADAFGYFKDENLTVELVRFAPLGDPVEIKVRGYHLTLRKHEAEQIFVQPRG